MQNYSVDQRTYKAFDVYDCGYLLTLSFFFILSYSLTTDTQREFFFQKFEAFRLGQTNWAEILRGILAISSQTIGTILAL